MNRHHYPLVILTAIVASPFCFVQQTSAQSGRPEFYQRAKVSVVLIENTSGVRRGTGFIVSTENQTHYVLTAGHVANKGEQLQITTDTNEKRRVDIVLPLPGIDLALLQFTSSNPQRIANLANDANGVQAANRIFVLGYPNGTGGIEITGGDVTSRQPSSSGVSSTIFHNALTFEGMSGSPVLDANGEVVGIHIGSPSPTTGYREAIPIEKYREIGPQVFTKAARDNLVAGNFDGAIASLQQISGLFGNNDEATIIRAYAYFGKGERPKAKEEIRRIVTSNANAALLAGAIDYVEKNFGSAISNLERANQLDRQNLGSYASALQGLSYAENSSFSEATRSANIGVTLADNDSFVFFARACVRRKTEDRGGATDDLNLANSPNRQASQQNPFLAVLKSGLQGLIKNCAEQGGGGGSPVSIPSQSGRYKSSSPLSLGEESTGLAVSRDSRYVATGLRNGTVSVYDLQTRRSAGSFSTGQGRDDISSIAFTPDGKNIAIAATNGVVKVFDFQTKQERYTIADAGSRPLLVFGNNGNFLFIGSGSGTLRMVDNRNGRIVAAEASTHRDGMASLTLSIDGRLLASGGGDGVVKLWSTSDLTPAGNYQAHQNAVVGLAFRNNDEIISIGDKVVRSCNWQNKRCNDIGTAQDALNSIAVATNGHLAYSETSFLMKTENPIFLRDLSNGQSLGILSGHRDRITGLAYTPDSRYLISGSSDGTIIIWEVQ